jgi:hypothetical protein
MVEKAAVISYTADKAATISYTWLTKKQLLATHG